MWLWPPLPTALRRQNATFAGITSVTEAAAVGRTPPASSRAAWRECESCHTFHLLRSKGCSPRPSHSAPQEQLLCRCITSSPQISSLSDSPRWCLLAHALCPQSPPSPPPPALPSTLPELPSPTGMHPELEPLPSHCSLTSLLIRALKTLQEPTSCRRQAQGPAMARRPHALDGGQLLLTGAP